MSLKIVLFASCFVFGVVHSGRHSSLLNFIDEYEKGPTYFDKPQWVWTKWGDCKPYPNKKPSNLGVMYRKASCVVVYPKYNVIFRQDSVGIRSVANDECTLAAPFNYSSCFLPQSQPLDLPKGRVEFTPWTACCKGYKYRTRIATQGKTPFFDVGSYYFKWMESPLEELYFNKTYEIEACSPEEVDKCELEIPSGNQLFTLPWGECMPHQYLLTTDWLGRNTLKRADHDTYFVHSPMVGFRQREFKCYADLYTQVKLDYCNTKNGSVHDLIYNQPNFEIQPCIVPEKCRLSEWSRWNITHRGCIDELTGYKWPRIMKRYRTILRYPSGDFSVERYGDCSRNYPGNGEDDPYCSEYSIDNAIEKCGPLAEKVTSYENLTACTENFEWMTSPWSKCLNADTGQPVKCGGGLKYRNLTCVYPTYKRPLPRYMCRVLKMPSVVERCEMPCPRECKVSEWSVWSACLPRCDKQDTNCVGVNSMCEDYASRTDGNKLGYRIRRRTIVVPPSNNSVHGCPHLEEAAECVGWECFTWKAERWSNCYLSLQNETCGRGHKIRDIGCYNHLQELVSDERCRGARPAAKGTCRVPCSGDCVLSNWSEWSSCGCDGKKNHQKTRRRTRYIIAEASYGGEPCPDERDSELLLETESCNESCDLVTYHWVERFADTFDSGHQWDRSCVANDMGQLTRVQNYHCWEAGLVAPQNTHSGDANNGSEAIELNGGPIPGGICGPTSAEWTQCPTREEICRNNSLGNGPFYQRRLTPLIDNSKVCAMAGLERECDEQPPCGTYVWSTSEWAPCALGGKRSVNCGEGLTTREIRCVDNSTGNYVALSNCARTNVQIPKSVMSCYVHCIHPPDTHGTVIFFAVSEWSPWTGCQSGICDGQAVRTRFLIPHGSVRVGLANQVNFPLSETRDCPCYDVHTEPRPWSECIVDDTTRNCGVGTRYRAQLCFKKNTNVLLHPSYCPYENGIEKEACMVSCPIDCQYTNWTKWEPYSSRIQIRYRTIIEKESNGGRPCGEFIQKRLCDNGECSKMVWKTGDWSSCMVLRRLQCGEGVRRRKVWCSEPDSNAVLSPLLCDENRRPEDEEKCFTYCPGQCVYSGWSDWSACTKNCSESDRDSMQFRTRQLIRVGEGEGCHLPITEQRSCQLNKTCFKYQWHGEKTTCIPLGINSTCGEGSIKSWFRCLRSDDVYVADSFCEKEPIPTEEKEKWCYIDCPIDCKIEEWTKWNDTECKCLENSDYPRHENNLHMTREAIVSVLASSTGRQCGPVVQSKPCPIVSCYAWIAKQYGPCRIEFGTCGAGYHTRELQCVQLYNGKVVRKEHCASIKRPYTRQQCWIPCFPFCYQPGQTCEPMFPYRVRRDAKIYEEYNEPRTKPLVTGADTRYTNEQEIGYICGHRAKTKMVYNTEKGRLPHCKPPATNVMWSITEQRSIVFHSENSTDEVSVTLTDLEWHLDAEFLVCQKVGEMCVCKNGFQFRANSHGGCPESLNNEGYFVLWFGDSEDFFEDLWVDIVRKIFWTTWIGCVFVLLCKIYTFVRRQFQKNIDDELEYFRMQIVNV